MEHINNMGYSLRAMKNLIGLIKLMKNSFLPNIFFYCDYPFLDAHAYFAAAEEFLDKREKTLREHLEMVRSVCEAMDGMERETGAGYLPCLYRCLAFSNGHAYWFHPKLTIDDLSMYYELLPSGEWEQRMEKFKFEYVIQSWCEIDNVQGYEFWADKLFEKVGKIKEELEELLHDASEETGNTQMSPNNIIIPDNILKLLAETKCSDGG